MYIYDPGSSTLRSMQRGDPCTVVLWGHAWCDSFVGATHCFLGRRHPSSASPSHLDADLDADVDAHLDPDVYWRGYKRGSNRGYKARLY